MAELSVVRLLQNPLGKVAPSGARGDIVRISNGTATIYLDPAKFDSLTEGQVHALLLEENLATGSGSGGAAEATAAPASITAEHVHSRRRGR